MPLTITEVPTADGGLPVVWLEGAAAPAAELGIVLPGQFFGCGAAPTYYMTLALHARRADVVWVNWSYDRDPGFRQLDPSGQEDRLLGDARAGMDAALARAPRERHVVAGKSLGTRAMALLMAEGRVPPGSRTIWLTPVLSDPRVRAAMAALDTPGLVLIGSRDPFFDAGHLGRLAEGGTCRVVVLDGADHGLVVQGDLPATAGVLERYLSALADYLAEP